MIQHDIPAHTQGRPEQSVAQAHISEIHRLKEQLRRENDGLKDTKQQLRDLQEKIKSEKEVQYISSRIFCTNTGRFGPFSFQHSLAIITLSFLLHVSLHPSLQESRVQSTLLQGNAELREMIASGEREKLERENQAILQEKLESLKLEIEQEKAELKARVQCLY